METKTLQEVIEFTVAQLKAANIRCARIDSSRSGCFLQSTRSFSVEGAIQVSFKPDIEEAKKGHKARELWRPVVNVNFPACSKDITRAAAFMGLVNELVPLAASIQAQLDEFLIPLGKGEG